MRSILPDRKYLINAYGISFGLVSTMFFCAVFLNLIWNGSLTIYEPNQIIAIIEFLMCSGGAIYQINRARDLYNSIAVGMEELEGEKHGEM